MATNRGKSNWGSSLHKQTGGDHGDLPTISAVTQWLQQVLTTH